MSWLTLGTLAAVWQPSGSVVALALVPVILTEIISAAKNRSWHAPRSLFTFGWTLPLLLAQIPLYHVTDLTAPLSPVVIKVSMVLTLLFFSLATNRPTQPVIPPNGLVVPAIVVLPILGLALIGFLRALAHAEWQLPMFAPDPTTAAKVFLPAAPGAATLFGLGEVACLFALVRIAQLLNRDYRGLEILVLVAAMIGFIGLSFLLGKRMGLILLVLSLGVLSIRLGLLTRYRMAALVIGCIALLLVTANLAYRSSIAYDRYYADQARLPVESPIEYAMFQPILYIQPNFRNLGDVIEGVDELHWGTHSLSPLLFRYEQTSSMTIFDEVGARPYNMRTFLAPAIMDFGVFGAVLFATLTFGIILQMYRMASDSLMATIVYALIAPRVALLFTGDLLFEPIFMRKLLFLLIAGLLLNSRRVQSLLPRETASMPRGANP